MKAILSDLQRRVLQAVQHGIPVTPAPFEHMARRAGVTTEEFLQVLKEWQQDGTLRRIGAVVNHNKMGYRSGAMVVWKVAPACIEKAGKIFAGFEQVSHAYEREAMPNWPYTLYTMVHGAEPDELAQTVHQMSQAAGVCQYRILTTQRELKKVPPTYSDCPERDNAMKVKRTK